MSPHHRDIFLNQALSVPGMLLLVQGNHYFVRKFDVEGSHPFPAAVDSLYAT